MNLTDTQIPDDVAFVWTVCMQTYCGADTYNQCRQIVRDNPQWFPWEHKYASIPNEVHEAYRKEIELHNEENKVLLPNNGNGLIPTILAEAEKRYYPPKDESFATMFRKWWDDAAEQRRKEFEEKEKSKAIWNKHYSKYNLEYSETAHFII